jgi:hypothetical protein
MNVRSVYLLAAMLLMAFVGCEGGRSTAPPSTAPAGPVPAGNVVFRDVTGQVVATADVELPERLPAGDGAFAGHWKLVSSTPGFPSHATRSGRYAGNVRGGLASIDLNRGVADSNVVLGWSAGAEPITGTWYHATFAGGKPMGTFAMTPRAGHVR